MLKKPAWIILLQTLVIIALIWLLAFYARDEYEAFQEHDEEEIASRSKVIEQDGLQMVQINVATQKNSGIQVEPLEPYDYQGSIKALGTVVSIQPLVDYNSQYQALKTQLALAESTLPNHQLQYQRLKKLNEDDKNVSDKVVQEANAVVVNNQAQIRATQNQIKALSDTIVAQWGPHLAELVTQPQETSPLRDMLLQRKVLVQVSFPLNYENPGKQSTIDIVPIHDYVKPITAQYISQSIQSDVSNIGKTYFYSAPADFLRVGMRVNVISGHINRSGHEGVRIPNQAIVWHAGLAWVYVRTKPDTFLRKPIAVTTEVEDGWYDESLTAGSEVVMRGAQLLLSEEFKFLIKNENDD